MTDTCHGTRPSRAHHGRTSRPTGPTRRSVVRAGVAAGWSAPLVQVISAAPAQAVGSGVVLDLTGTFTHASNSRAVTFTSGNLANNGTQTTTNLQITVTLTTNGTTNMSGTTVSTTPSGFTVGSGTLGGSSGAFTITFVFTKSTPQVAGGSSTAFAPAFQVPNNAVRNTAGSGSATATSTGAAPDVATNSYLG